MNAKDLEMRSFAFFYRFFAPDYCHFDKMSPQYCAWFVYLYEREKSSQKHLTIFEKKCIIDA